MFHALFLLALTAVSAVQYDKFFMMMFENHGYNQVMSNSAWKKIVNDGYSLTKYYGVTHPSQPNYVAQIGGTYSGCTSDSNCNLDITNLVDLLEAKNVSWKTYQENYVAGDNGDCNMASSISSKYYRKHNPFISFTDVSSNLTRCQKIVPASPAIDQDVANNALPQFGYYTPNINDDSHNQNLDYSANYLSGWLDDYFYKYPKAWENVLFFITFDEDEGSEGNHIVAFFPQTPVSPAPGDDSSNPTSYTHYSVTKFVETNWNLGDLGRNDKSANSFNLPAAGTTSQKELK